MRRSALLFVSTLWGSLALAQDAPWYETMDYGPMLCTTLRGGDHGGVTYKGIVVRLPGNAAFAFDTELLRMSSAWTDGWLSLRGTAYDGSHGPMVEPHGNPVAATRQAPGWALDGSFADPREIPYGPLPRDKARYEGLALCGDQVVISYRVGDMAVREGYRVVDEAQHLLGRTLELGASAQEQRMVVLDGPAEGVHASGAGPFAMLEWQPKMTEPVDLDTADGAWDTLRMGGPAKGDYLDPASGTGATIAFVPGFSRVHGRAEPAGGDTAASLALPMLADGAGQDDNDDLQRSVWFDARKVGNRDRADGRFVVDLQRAVDVSRVDTFSWHRAERCAQRYELFGSAAEQTPDVAAKDPAAAGWTAIASVDSTSLGEGGKHGVGIAKLGGLGSFRHLLFVVRSGGTFFSEIDVFADRFHAAVDEHGLPSRAVACAVHGDAGPQLACEGSRIVLIVPPHKAAQRVELLLAAGDAQSVAVARGEAQKNAAVAALPTKPAAARWGAPIEVKGERGQDDGPFAVDTITVPFENRFGSRMRTCAFDFFDDGRAAITTWNGDVWIVSGIDDDLAHVSWRRYATGLFDPLGLRIVDGKVIVHGRDGLTRLHDDNGDGEADRYECLCNQIYITDAFHEFAFDLQTDAEGNFYISKAAPVNPGGRGFMKIVPHHGTILKISKDGSKVETVATGLRAPNGIGVSPTGIITSGDNEGTYIPRCRLNWIEKPGFYAGVKDTAHRSPVPDQPDLPLCWMPMDVDNSSGGQVWVTGKGWPDLADRLLHLSYGTCSVYLVLPERVDGHMQGGVVRLPANFSSSCMRARFSPKDGELYVAGFQGWQTSAARDGGFHRVRRTQKPLGLPIALRTSQEGVYLTFAEPLDPASAADAENYSVEIWNYLYSGNYGSPELSVLHPEREAAEGQPNRDPLKVTKAALSPDRRTVFLAVSGMRPVMQMKVTWNVDAADGETRKGELHNSIHALAADHGFAEAK